MRPILRPGSHVLRRDDHELQVGLDPRRAVVLPDEPHVRACLDRLGRSARVDEYDAPATLDLLLAHGLVLDGSGLMPLIPTYRDGRDGPTTVTRAAVAALARSSGDEAGNLLAARARTRVSVVPCGNSVSAGLADDLTSLVREAGLEVRSTGRSTGAVDVVALVGVGEPQREATDDWMRAGTAHLPVRLTEGSATVGPFVVPGQTACLRCVDAHHTDADPSWPLLVAQYASLASGERADGVPEPVDGMVAGVALAWAARDLASYAEGRRPSTWSTTIRFDPHLCSIETQSWLRHPACGCSWG